MLLYKSEKTSGFFVWHIPAYLDRGFREDVLRQLVHVSLVVNDLGNAGIYEDLGAQAAGESGGIDDRSLEARSVIRGLRHGVLFGMHAAAQLVACTGGDVEFHAQTSRILTVRDPFRSTVVSRGQNVLVLHNDSSHMPAEAGGTGRYQFCHFHEIFVR